MTEQQAPFGESDQMWTPPQEQDSLRRETEAYARKIDRAVIVRLRKPEPAAVCWVVQNHSFVRDRSQVVRMLRAYADALEQVILPAVKP